MTKDRIFREKGFECSPFGATRNAGVYAICVVNRNGYPPTLKNIKVVYIGSSKNVYSRLQGQNHIYRRLYNLLKNYDVCCFWVECDNYCEVEIALIKKYEPRFNIVHKPNPFKTKKCRTVS